MTPEIRKLAALNTALHEQERRLAAERESLEAERRRIGPPALDLTNLNALLGKAEVAAARGGEGPSPDEVLADIARERKTHADRRAAAEKRTDEIAARLLDLPGELSALQARRRHVEEGFKAACLDHLMQMQQTAEQAYAEARGAVEVAFAELLAASSLSSQFGGRDVVRGVLHLPGTDTLDAVAMSGLSETIQTRTNEIRSALYEGEKQ